MTRLAVAFDARRLQDQPLLGVGRALHHVLELVAREIDVVLLTDARHPAAPTDLPQVGLRPPPRFTGLMWLEWTVARWLRSFDGVFHGTFNAIPHRLAVPGVVTIHDLSFELHHEGFSPAKRWVFQREARWAASHARRVVTVSEHAKRDLVEHYRLAPEDVLVARWGIDPSFRPDRAAAAPPVLERLGVRSPYVIALGGAPRRGVEIAIGAWRQVHSEGRDVTLVVVGSPETPSEPGLVSTGVVADDEWVPLLAAAEAFCYPTRFEGFGLPAVESIASGTPVVCARVGPLPEVLGDAAEWCDAPNEPALAAGLRRLLDDPDHAADVRDRGLRWAARHSGWDDAAEAHVRAYREAAAV